MSDNNAGKAVGLLAILGVMFAKTCKTDEHQGSTFLKSCKAAEQPRINPREVFPSEKPRVNEIPPITLTDVPPITSTPHNETPSIRNEDEVFLKKTSENEFSYTDKTTSTFSSLGDFKIDNSKTLIVDGKLTDDEIKALNRQGVKFICDKDVYEKQKNITSYQVIFVFSEDREVLKDLYGVSDEQVDDLIKIAQPAFTDINSTKVSSQGQLESALAAFKKDNITPIVVFNNKDKTLFGNPLSYYGVSNVITCNSYNLGGEIFFNSTDYLGIDQVIKSLVNIKQATLFDFYKNFSFNYATQLYKDKQYLVTVVAASAIATGAGGGFIIYYNLNEKS